ncbi:MAG: DNA-binding protein WhiA [Clostridia bacterium]|nr:DNA-binding protein WhiA [Clostridia bacterium]
MSFSADVKQELCNLKRDRGTDSALLCGAILSAGSLVIAPGKGVSFTLSSENGAFVDFIKKIISENYTSATFTEEDTNVGFKQKTRKELSVESSVGRQILTDLGILEFNKDGQFTINRLGDSALTIEENSKIAYLKGMFLGAGSISVPAPVNIDDFSKSVKNSGYHMEWVVQSGLQAQKISELLAQLNIICRSVERGETEVVYIKEADSISTVLGLFGAVKSLLELENQRAGRQMRNLVNRQANCISANIDKSINAALVQLEAIETIKNTVGLEALPDTLLDVALARLANPEGSLNEICEVLPTKISKGAVSQRFKKIIEIAKEVG